MATFSAHTASPPPPSRTPAGSRASSRHAAIAPRTTSAHGPLAWAAPRTRIIDQSQLRQCQRELHASQEQSLTRLPLELPNGLPQIPAHELPRSNRPGSGCSTRRTSLPRRSSGRRAHPIRRGSLRAGGRNAASIIRRSPAGRGGRRPGRGSRPRDDASLRPRTLHGDRSTVQCDVDGKPKRSHT